LILRAVSDPSARVDATAPTGLIQAGYGAGLVTPAAIYLCTRRVWLALALAGLLVAPMWGVTSRQAVITPIFLVLLVVIAVRFRGRPLTFQRALSVSVAIVLISGVVYLVTTRLTEERARPRSGLQASGSLQQVLAGETINDIFFVTVAFEPRPQLLGIYGDTAFAFVPRIVWPDKPVPYDFRLREKYLPAFEGGTPIGIVGTSYLSFLEPGLMVIGLAFGFLLARAAIMLESSDARRVLLGAFVDFARVGGGLRELSTLIPQMLAVAFIFRRVQPGAPALQGRDSSVFSA
jgi:hypothetical protein